MFYGGVVAARHAWSAGRGATSQDLGGSRGEGASLSTDVEGGSAIRRSWELPTEAEAEPVVVGGSPDARSCDGVQTLIQVPVVLAPLI
jgi:hypothetical protein